VGWVEGQLWIIINFDDVARTRHLRQL